MNNRAIKALLNKSLDIHKIHLTIIGWCVDCACFMSATNNQVALRDIIEMGKLKCTGQCRWKLERVENPKGEVHIGDQRFDICHDKMVGGN